MTRQGGAVAVTIKEPIPGFRGLRVRWWPREAEHPFPDWKTAGIVVAARARALKPAPPMSLFERVKRGQT